MLFACLLAAPALSAALAPLPVGWPSDFQIGSADGAGGAAALKQRAPFGFRYAYLSAGVNTGSGWSTWNPNGAYATYWIQDSVNNGIIPMFTYYQLLQSKPATGGDESAKDRSNLNNTTTMQAYYADFRLLLQKCAAFPAKLVFVQIEPDFWGYVEQSATGGDPTTVPAKVGACGGDVAAFADNAAGFAKAMVHLRDLYAPNVVLGYHVSVFGANWDLLRSTPKADDAKSTALGVQAGNFFNALGANFDILTNDLLDRDNGYYQVIQGATNSWYQTVDYRNHRLFTAGVCATANRRMILWQNPLGNTWMRSCNQTWDHYQSNQVEWFLGSPADSSRTNIDDYIAVGLVGVIFGGGAGGCTAAADADGDGVTNPAAITNSLSSNAGPNDSQSALGPAGSAPVYNVGTKTLTTPYAKDDDGGFFQWKAHDYYQSGTTPVPSAGGASKLVFTGQPGDTVAGAAIAPAVQVTIEDAGSATVNATYGVTLTVSAGPGTLAGTRTVAAVGGVATFSNIYINTIGTGYVLTASSGLLTTAASSSFAITPPPPPTVASFAPTASGIGTTVTVNGTGFGNATATAFNGTVAAFTIASATQITATVPVGATTGVITVSNPGGAGSSASAFTVVPPPVITGIAPTAASAGATVTITGTNLAGVTAVVFNGTAATTFAANGAGTQITSTVPAGAVNGPVTVITPGGSTTSTTSITTGIAPPSASSGGKCGGGGLMAMVGLLLTAFVARRLEAGRR